MPIPQVSLVYDDAVTGERMAQPLRAAGYAVTVFTSAIEFMEGGIPRAGCAVFPIRMRYFGGLDVLRAIRSSGSPVAVVVLCGGEDLREGIEAFRLGAADVLVEPVDPAEVLRAVEVAGRRKQEAASRGQWLGDLNSRYAALTPRQKAVCRLVLRGLMHREIAAKMGISEGTVKLSRNRAMAKLGASSSVELAYLLGVMGIRPDDEDDSGGAE